MLAKVCGRVYDAISGRGVLSPESMGLNDSEATDARAAGARFSRGNIPIQHEAFVTTEDLEREREYLTAHPFPG